MDNSVDGYIDQGTTTEWIVYDNATGIIEKTIQCSMPDYVVQNYMTEYTQTAIPGNSQIDTDRYYVDIDTQTIAERPQTGAVGTIAPSAVVGDTLNVSGLPIGSEVVLARETGDAQRFPIGNSGAFNYVYQEVGDYYWSLEYGIYQSESKIVTVQASTQMLEQDVLDQMNAEVDRRIAYSNWVYMPDSGLQQQQKNEWTQYRAAVRAVPSQNVGETDYSNVEWPNEP